MSRAVAVKAGSRPPWVGLAAAVWVQVAGGSGYNFPLYSHALKSVLGYNQQQVTMLGVANDVGENFGLIPGVICNRLPPWVLLLIGSVSCFLGYGVLWLAVSGTVQSPPLWLVPEHAVPPNLLLRHRRSLCRSITDPDPTIGDHELPPPLPEQHELPLIPLQRRRPPPIARPPPLHHHKRPPLVLLLLLIRASPSDQPAHDIDEAHEEALKKPPLFLLLVVGEVENEEAMLGDGDADAEEERVVEVLDVVLLQLVVGEGEAVLIDQGRVQACL
ncbi:hypothetical protein QJS04_geneDACA003748 [Acorus gramineus]|uniref:Nodulin-like domain-containing protein n=1 Tax=Acorus gramineus TaxID=55184 RepID=A0AAV9BKM9_ACOGR|nr:hypothetical protein QJS04_geneDACA003748 [Acorus gramineus]